MADNNLARSRNDLPDFFADDDPLAELARIVGYDDRLVASPPAPSAAELRREPAFNLEDELLREFERYDAPHADPLPCVTAEPAAVDAEPPVAVYDHWDERREGVGASTGFDAAGDRGFVSVVSDQDQDLPVAPAPLDTHDRSNEEPAFRDQSMFAAEIERASYSHAETAAPPAPAAHLLSQSHKERDGGAGASNVAFEPIVDEFDLVGELESTFAVEPVVEPRAEERRLTKTTGYTPGFRMPLTNFHVARRTEPDLGRPPAAVPGTAASPGVGGEFAAEEGALKISVPETHGVPEDVHVAAPVDVAAVAPPLPAVDASSMVLPERGPLPAQGEVVSELRQPSSEPAGSVAASAPMPIDAMPPISIAESIQRQDGDDVAVGGQRPLEVEIKDPFSDDEFELALDDLELDLADIVVDEVRQEPELLTRGNVADEASAFVEAPAQQMPSRDAAPAAVEIAEDLDVADLPFDPAQIADADDQVEAIAELEVPSLPVEEAEQPSAYRPDYEMDLDAELAALLMTPDRPEVSPVSKPEIDIAAARQPSAERPVRDDRPGNYADLDDFERALEEDFRRSMAAPLAPARHEEDLHYADAGYLATVEEARRSVLAKWGAPLAAAGAVVLAGLGAYAWLGSNAPGTGAGGEPMIIAADADPVKVAPENPGGKTVPNQDKAVYDRVAGVASHEPKQQQLISSSEEPMDVVQKTLMPDTIPLEDNDELLAMESGGEQDARLLPDEQDAVVPPPAEQPVTVTARRVKTMIVRPDGKLVEQEVPAPVVAAPSADKLPAAGVKPAEIASQMPAPSGTLSQSSAVVADATPAAAAVVPASLPSGPSAEPAGATISDLAAAAPIEDGAAMPVSAEVSPANSDVPAEDAASAPIRAPVPTSRPSEQPVNVVAAVTDQGTVRAPGQPSSAAGNEAANGAGGYVIQIASLPSQADAQKSYQNLSTKFAAVIGGRGVDIKAAEIAGKGTFYRVRIPAGSKSDAVALCEKYRAAGGSCLVAR